MKIVKVYLLVAFLCSAFALHAELYAVIVGVSKYKDPSDNLFFAASDAKKFHDLLTGNKQNPNIVLLTDDKATHKNIMNTINATFSKAKTTDRIILFFSGHGTDGYFCQYDAGDSYESLLNHEDIQSAFKRSKASVKMCIVDACFAGSLKNVHASNTKSSVNYFKEYKAPSNARKDNIIIFTSSREDQYSQEDIFLGQGLFTYYLIQAFLGKADVNNDKKVTAKEMYTYVRTNMAARTKNTQIPVMFGQFSENTVIVSYK